MSPTRSLRVARARPRRPAPPLDVDSGRRQVVRVRPLPGGVRHREHASTRPGLFAVGVGLARSHLSRDWRTAYRLDSAPGLRGRCAALRHQAGDGALGHVDAELEELAVDSGGTPQGIRRGHFPDQGGELGVDGRAAASGLAGERGPAIAEAAALPPQNGSRGYDHEGLPPPGPDPGQPDPEEAIYRAKLGPRLRPPVHGELVAQGQVLEGELAMAAAEEREKSKQVEQEGDL